MCMRGLCACVNTHAGESWSVTPPNIGGGGGGGADKKLFPIFLGPKFFSNFWGELHLWGGGGALRHQYGSGG